MAPQGAQSARQGTQKARKRARRLLRGVCRRHFRRKWKRPCAQHPVADFLMAVADRVPSPSGV